MNKKKPFTVPKNFENNLALGLTSVTLVFINVCLPALAIAALLYWIFGR